MELDPNYFSKIPVEIFEELDKMSKEKDTIIKPENNKEENNPGFPSAKDIKDKNILSPENTKTSKSSEEPKKETDVEKSATEDDKKASDAISKTFKGNSDKNIEEIKKALGETDKKEGENKNSSDKIKIKFEEDGDVKEDKSATEDFKKKIKDGDKKSKENKSSSEKNDNKSKKDDKISTILSATEKKRYENLGKAFMIGADAAFSEIQDAIDKKEKNKLSDKDGVESKIKNAEEKLKKDKTKKSSVLKNIAIAAAALGGLVLIFGTINGSFSTIFTKIKNGIVDFGYYIKNSATSILSFFGNMFVKASQTMSKGGFLTTIMGGIIWDFFNFTLPTMVIGLVEDLVRIIDKSFNSSVKLNENQSKLENTYKQASNDVDGTAESIKKELDKFLLMQETDIRNNGILTKKFQEDITDDSISILGNMTSSFVKSLNAESSQNRELIKGWSNNLLTALLSNQYASTRFYENSKGILRSIEMGVPDIVKMEAKNLSKEQENFIKKFAEMHQMDLNMAKNEVTAFASLSTEEQLKIIKNLSIGISEFRNKVEKDISEAESKANDKTDKGNIVEILKTIHEDVKNKNTDLKIIKFQETKEIGKLNLTIRNFLYNSNFLDAMQSMSSTMSDKLGMILNASNLALSDLPRAIANNFVATTGDEKITYSNIDDNSGLDTTQVALPEDYKLMYIFNNNVPYMNPAIDNEMHMFLNFSVAYAQLMSQEISVLSQLERLTNIMTNGIYYNSHLVTKVYEKITDDITKHVKTPVQEDGGTAHILVVKHPSLASNDTPLMATNSGMMII